MNLSKIVRTKFMPPENISNDGMKYSIKEICGEYFPILNFNKTNFCYVCPDSECFCENSAGLAKSFKSMSEAIEFCWANFDRFFKHFAENYHSVLDKR